jgi:asparagine synthase (glutamine-hydrolysing)
MFESVQNRLVSKNYPISLLVSGGLDSSIIAAILAELKADVRWFSIENGEKEYIDILSKHLDKGVTFLDYSMDNSLLKEIYQIWNEGPIDLGSVIPQYHLFKAIKENSNHRIVLSGDGADELFGGYNRYVYIERIWKIIGFFPIFLRKKICEILLNININTYEKFFIFLSKVINLNSINQSEKFIKLLEKIKYAKNKDEFFLSFLHEWKNIDDILNFNGSNNFFTAEYNKIPSSIYGLRRMLEFDKKFYLPDDILCKVDRSSMFYGLETRAPYLNKGVHDFSKRIPNNFLISNKKSKIILREILKKYIPEDLPANR